MKSNFVRGMSHGIPIALGYLSVSFAVGIAAAGAGLSALAASIMSAVNLTSAGQLKGIDLIAAGTTIIEVILTQLTINIRYSLMGLSLSQKLDKSFTFPHRLIASYGITDEIFAVCSSQPGRLTPPYMYGMILVSAAGWVTGTFLGAYAGQLLPASVTAALGLMIYGMFLAIIVPPAKKSKSVLCVVAAAAVLSIIFKYLITAVSGGFSVIICSIAAAALGALLFPINEDEEDDKS